VGLSSLTPEAHVELVPADAQVAHREIGQPGRKRWVDIELVARRVRENDETEKWAKVIRAANISFSMMRIIARRMRERPDPRPLAGMRSVEMTT
jgi:hypothetical protein